MSVKPLHNEKELLIQIAGGSKKAFSRLFYAYHNPLGEFVLTLTRSPELAEEIVLDVFVKVWMEREKLLEIEKFTSYLFIICRNYTLNCIRKIANDQKKQELLRPILRNERRVELALEGIRYWDLLRWKTAETELNDDFYGAPYPGAVRMNKKGGQADPYSRWYVTSRKFRAGVDYLWPVPQSELNINPALGQNTGY